jgi:hypothetical protein
LHVDLGQGDFCFHRGQREEVEFGPELVRLTAVNAAAFCSKPARVSPLLLSSPLTA